MRDMTMSLWDSWYSCASAEKSFVTIAASLNMCWLYHHGYFTYHKVPIYERLAMTWPVRRMHTILYCFRNHNLAKWCTESGQTAQCNTCPRPCLMPSILNSFKDIPRVFSTVPLSKNKAQETMFHVPPAQDSALKRWAKSAAKRYALLTLVPL